MEFVDTHCHVHFADYQLDPDEVIASAVDSGVTRMICVGCTLEDSKLGIEMSAKHRSVWASIGVHPHESKLYVENQKALQELRELATKPRVVAVGEIGLDYYYNHSDKQSQAEIFRFQLDIAKQHDLPVIFHVREAFDDFFAIMSDFKGIRGVVHSYTANQATLDKCLNLGLYMGLNGIMTFTKDANQLDVAKAVPIDRLVLETDAPFLTPVPFRGKICQPKYVVETAKFLANIRGESLEELAMTTTNNARQLFRI
ncbi:TatD family hydrolase [Candidatus Saccharibacteria bacterium]|nr:TatD family hydrolase [Candidatus Saccharibacteria bacterium]